MKKDNNLPKQKFYYDVKVDITMPATLTYKVFAESPEQAAEMISHMQPNQVQHKLHQKKNLKITVYELGSCMIKFIRKLV